MTIAYYMPASVRVSDDRGHVAGAAVTITRAAEVLRIDVIPPEGDSLDCWVRMHDRTATPHLSVHEIDALIEAAREGAAGRSGRIAVEPVDELEAVATTPAWDYVAMQYPNHVGKTHMLRFLPYFDTTPIIGYDRHGRRHGRWEEFFYSLEAARERMRYLAEAGAIEDAEIYEDLPGAGFGGMRLVDEWRAEQPTEEND